MLITPESPTSTLVWETNPLQNLPNFNVHIKHAPELQEDAPWSPRTSPQRVRSSSEAAEVTKVTLPSTAAATVRSPGAAQSNPNSQERRPSTGATSTASSAAQKRMNRMLETLAGNGTRRAFTSPDGKVKIKLTAFSPPSSMEVKETYIGNVTNPRSKSPAVVRVHQQKKKQEDDFAKSIVEANRKAVEDKALAERNRRRVNSKSTLNGAPAAYKSTLAAESKAAGRLGSPKRSPGKSQQPKSGELELFRVEPLSPVKRNELISFHGFVQVNLLFFVIFFLVPLFFCYFVQ